MKLLTNPVFVRMAVVPLTAVAAFILGIVVLRVLRRRIVEGDALPQTLGRENTLYPYSAVIQELKQQKFALQNEQQAQRRRAKTSEHITAAVIANLPCGILFVAPNGLVRQANAAARRILGFASPLGLSVDELFRNARGVSESRSRVELAPEFQNVLRGQVTAQFEASYRTPNGEERVIKLMLLPMSAPEGETIGAGCVISDETEIADLRRAQLLRSETAAEMALELRTSLSTICQCAQQMSTINEPGQTRRFAADISAEAERLDRLVGGFLAGQDERKAYAAKA